MRPHAAAALACAALAGSAPAADTVVFTIGSPSDITLELCQDLPIVGGCDTDTSGVSGTVTLVVDTTGGTVQLVDFMLTTDSDLTYTYTGLLSSVTATAPSVDVFYDGVGPTPPGPLVADAFSLSGVPINLAGIATVNGTILGAGTVNETIDFADFGPFIADLDGTVAPDGMGGYTLDASFSFDETTVGDVMGITVTTTATGTLTLVGAGSVVPAGCNPADLNADGTLSLDDIDTFITAFLGGDLLADLDGSGGLSLDDIDTFIAAFLAGCP